LLQHPKKTLSEILHEVYEETGSAVNAKWMRRIPNVSEFLLWYEIECIGKMQMQAERGGPFEITWELIRTNFNVIPNEWFAGKIDFASFLFIINLESYWEFFGTLIKPLRIILLRKRMVCR
jgi:hypothetical protein